MTDTLESSEMGEGKRFNIANTDIEDELATGPIYRYRGFTTAVMTHALGNWVVVMVLLR
ncbi:MAG: hypothetical protein PVG14_19900 [Anaerolineales bacterium]